MELFTCFLLAGAFVITQQMRMTPRVDPTLCTKAGPQCVSACQDLVMCVDLGGAVYQAFDMMSCNTTAGSFCSEKQQDCSARWCNADDITTQPMACTAKGTFPNNYDCTKFFYCLNAGSKLQEYNCPPDKAFNITGGYCDLPLTDWTCTEKPVPRCTKLGQDGVLRQKPQLFYVCQVNANGYLVANMYSCKDKMIYDASKHACVVEPPPTTTSSTTTTTTSTSSTTESTANSTEPTTTTTEGDGGAAAVVVSWSVVVLVAGSLFL